MDRGAWLATVHGAAKRQTRLSTHTHTHMLGPPTPARWPWAGDRASQSLLVFVSGDVMPAAGSVLGASLGRLMLLLQPYQVFRAWKSGPWAPLHAEHPTLPSPLEHPAGVGMFARSLAPCLQPSSGSSAGAAHARPSFRRLSISSAASRKNQDIAEQLLAHIADTTMHVTADEKTFWNNKSSAFVETAETETLVLSNTHYMINGVVY